MEKNVGGIDRNIRIVLGIAFLAIGVFTRMGTGLKIGAFAVAVIAFATAYLSF